MDLLKKGLAVAIILIIGMEIIGIDQDFFQN